MIENYTWVIHYFLGFIFGFLAVYFITVRKLKKQLKEIKYNDKVLRNSIYGKVFEGKLRK